MKQTILFGNGLRRIGNNKSLEWKKVLNDLLRPGEALLGKANEDSLNLPYPHLYEDILLNQKAMPQNYRDMNIFSVEDHIKKELGRNLINNESSSSENLVYDKLLSLKADYYLTTNYDKKFNIKLRDSGYEEKVNERHYYERVFSLQRREVYQSKRAKHILSVWPIHGDITKMDTLMLGYDHYCAYISKIDKYLKTGDNGSPKHPISKIKEYNTWKKYVTIDYKPYIRFLRERYSDGSKIDAWVDTFFFTDVHIIGFGYDLSEIDLWWILNKRYRVMNEQFAARVPILKNQIYCYGYYEPNVLTLLKAYGVETCFATSKKPENDEWERLYMDSLESMRKNMKT